MMSLNDISAGTIIVYRLRNVDRPINPDRLWRGRVKHYHPSIHLALVTLLDEEYEGLEDWVWQKQIVGLEPMKGYNGIQKHLPLMFGVIFNP